MVPDNDPWPTSRLRLTRRPPGDAWREGGSGEVEQPSSRARL